MNSFRSGYDAGRELNSGRFVRERGIELVDRPDLDDGRAPALIEAHRRVDQIGVAERELPNEVAAERRRRLARRDSCWRDGE